MEIKLTSGLIFGLVIILFGGHHIFMIMSMNFQRKKFILHFCFVQAKNISAQIPIDFLA